MPLKIRLRFYWLRLLIALRLIEKPKPQKRFANPQDLHSTTQKMFEKLTHDTTMGAFKGKRLALFLWSEYKNEKDDESLKEICYHTAFAIEWLTRYYNHYEHQENSKKGKKAPKP